MRCWRKSARLLRPTRRSASHRKWCASTAPTARKIRSRASSRHGSSPSESAKSGAKRPMRDATTPCGKWTAASRGPHLLFTGHLDTKPVCEGWQRDPFDGAIENGRLYGHGVMDMKAGLGSLIGGDQDADRQRRGFQGQDHVCGGRRSYGSADRQHRSVQTSQVRPLRARRTDRHAGLHRASRAILLRHFHDRPLGAHLPQVSCHQCDREDAAGRGRAVEAQILPRHFPGDEGAGRAGALHCGRPHLRRAVSRRPVDDPGSLHDPRRHAAATGRSHRGGQGGHSSRRSTAPRRAIRRSSSKWSTPTSRASSWSIRMLRS